MLPAQLEKNGTERASADAKFVETLTAAYRAALQDRSMRVSAHAHGLIGNDPDRIDEVIAKVRRMLGTPRAEAELVATVKVVCHLLRQGAALLMSHRRYDEALAREELVFRVGAQDPTVRPALVSIRTLAAHVAAGKLPHSVLREATTAGFESPEFFGRGPVGEGQECALPPVVVAQLRKVTVRGRSEAIGVSRQRTLHDIAPLDSRGRWAHRDFLHHDSTRAIETRPRKGPRVREMSRAILLTGSSSDNYYHFLTEVLPKLEALEADPPPPGVPLLVDAEMIATPQLAEILDKVSGGRPRIALGAGETVRVGRLTAVSAVTWMPTNLRPGAEFRAGDQRVDHASLAYVRSRLRTADAGRSPVRLFVRRGITPRRRLLNEDVLVRLAEARGFMAVSPGQLDSATQVDLFSRAEAIVGAAGGGMANAIFAPAGARVLVMMSRCYDFSLFHTVSSLLEQSVLHLGGVPRSNSGVIALHDDYSIDPSEFSNALDSLDV